MMDCSTSKYQINFDVSFIFHIMVIFWYHVISIFNNRATMDCSTSKHQINCEILRIWYYQDILILSDYINFDTSLVSHLTVIFWYHDILRFKNQKHNNHKCVLPGSLIIYQIIVIYQIILVLQVCGVHSSLFRHVLLEMSVKSSVFKRAVQAITNDSMLYGARKAITNGRTFF